MGDRLKRLLAPPVYEDEITNTQARFLNVILLAGTSALIFLYVVRLITGAARPTSGSALMLGGLAVVLLGIFLLTQFRYLRSGIYALLSVTWLVVTLLAWSAGGVKDAAFMGYLVVILAASLLSGWRLALIFIGLTVAAGWSFVYAESIGRISAPDPDPAAEMMTVYTFILGLSAVMIYLLVSTLQNALRRAQQGNRDLHSLSQELEKQVRDRTQALETSFLVSRYLTTILDQQTLAAEVVNQVRSTFNYYHAQMYLFDDFGQELILVGSTGEAGQALLAGNHKISAGQGVVGRAARHNAVILVPDTRAAVDWLPNPLLPETKAEAAVPISLDDQVLGVLDVQHNVVNGLTEDDTRLMEAVASQVAVALRNARLFAQTQQQARQEALINEIGRHIQSAITVEQVLQVAAEELVEKLEIRRAAVEISREAIVGGDGKKFGQPAEDDSTFSNRLRRGWALYLDAIHRQEKLSHVHDSHSRESNSEEELGSNLIEQNSLRFPINIGDISLGAIGVEAGDGRIWPEESRSLITAVAQQVAQQAENLRLLAEARQYRLEAEKAVQRLTREGWKIYQDEELLGGFVYDGTEVKPLTLGQADQLVTDRIFTLPLVVHGETVGHLELAGVPVLDDETKEMLPAFAEQLSEHIENLRLTKQTELALAQTERLFRIGSALNAANNEQEILEAAVNPLIEDGLHEATLMLIESAEGGEPEILEISADWRLDGRGTIPLGTRIRLAEFPFTSLFMRNPHEPQFIADVAADDRVDALTRDAMLEVGLQALAVVPLTVGGRWVGILTFGWSASHRFSHQAKEYFNALINLAAPVVQSQRLLAQTRKQAEKERLINVINRRIQSTVSVESALQAAVSELGKALNASQARVALSRPVDSAAPQAAVPDSNGRQQDSGEVSE